MCAIKWFKHISDSLDDPFIFDLTSEFGGDGYLVFFGVLEIYSREFKTELNWKLNVSQRYLTRKLNKRQSTLVVKILKHIQNSGKWDIDFNGPQVSIYIPKFTELIDNWSQRKLRSGTVDTPSKHQLNKDKRSKKKIKKETKKVSGIPYSEQFLEFWSAYPRKVSKGSAWKAWQKLNGVKPENPELIQKINLLKETPDWKKDGGQFIPYPATWLNAAGWEDEVGDASQQTTRPESKMILTDEDAMGAI